MIKYYSRKTRKQPIYFQGMGDGMGDVVKIAN